MALATKRTFIDKVKAMFGTPAAPAYYDLSNVNYLMTGSRVITSTATVQNQAKAYNSCPPVAAIVNRKAKAFINAKWWLLDKDGNEPKGAGTKELYKLMGRPNVMQSWRAFLMQAKIFEQTFGEVFIYAVRPEGMKTIKALWVIPNWMIEPKAGKIYFNATARNDVVQYYDLHTNGYSVQIDTEDIFHHKDISLNSDNLISGQSRLVSLQDPVSNIIASYEARNVLITRRGAIGILSNEGKDSIGTTPLLPGEKEDLQEDFKKYGVTRGQLQVIISNAGLKWQSMTFPTKDLMLFEEIEDDVRQIADNYDYPMHLLGFKGGTTFSNMNEAKKSLYQDAIMPEAELFAEGLNDFINPDPSFTIQAFYDHLDIFQQSQKDVAAALKIKNEGMKVAYAMGVVTLEEWRTAIDYDPTIFNGKTFYNGNTTVV